MDRLTKRGTRTKSYVSAIGSGVGCWGRIIDRLAAYENTGLEPEEIMGLCSMHERAKMAELLRAEENRPLTLEELREMGGEPVWLMGEGLARYDIFCGETTDHIAQFYKEALPAWAYGRTWRAYFRKPEEESS